jgi:aromatic-L-amino-acid decarboxylase
LGKTLTQHDVSKEEFCQFGHAMIDYIIDYHDNIGTRPVLPSVKPGYLRPLIPNEAPEEPEQWQDVMQDLERVIMPGVTHWHSPQYGTHHSYVVVAHTLRVAENEILKLDFPAKRH